MTELIHSILPQPQRSIVFTHPDVSVSQCVELMVTENIGAVVVTDDDNLLGIVSERDIVRSLVHKKLSPDDAKVSDILYADVSILKHTDPVEKAMETITQTKRRHVLITEEGQLIAILSIGDILFSLLESKSREIEQLENYIHTY